jgi:hypothetical protein
MHGRNLVYMHYIILHFDPVAPICSWPTVSLSLCHTLGWRVRVPWDGLFVCAWGGLLVSLLPAHTYSGAFDNYDTLSDA